MKGSTYLLVSLLLSLVAFSSQNGILFADQINPLTQDYVSIPSLGAGVAVATDASASSLQGNFPSFTINAVGGISLSSTGANTVTVPGDISYSAPVSGDISLVATQTNLASSNDLSIWSATQGIFNVANDLTINSGEGDFNIQSYLSTSVDAIYGIQIGSLYRDASVSAPAGTTEFTSSVISFASGSEDENLSPSFFLDSNSTIDVRATKLFTIDANELYINTTDEFTFQSGIHNVKLQTVNSFNGTANSNVILKTVSDATLETLLNDFTVNAGSVVSLYAHGSFVYAQSLFIDSNNVVNLNSAGTISFADTTGTSITATNIDLIALPGSVSWTATDGDIDVTVAQMSVSSNNIIFTTSLVPGANVKVNTLSGLSFLTSNSDINFQSTFADIITQGNINLTADNNVYLIGVRHSDQPNLIAPNGYASYAADKGYTVSANEIDLNANGGIVFTDASSITISADQTFNVDSYNLFYQSSNSLISFQAANAIFSSGLNANYLANNEIDITVGSLYAYGTGNLYATASPSRESNILITSTSLSLKTVVEDILLDAPTINVEASNNINFNNDNLDTQNLLVNGGTNLQFVGGNVTFQSNTSINYLAPTGNIDTNSFGNTDFSGNEGLFRSITGSIFFNFGPATVEGNTVNFRAGELISWNAVGFDINAVSKTFEVNSGVGIGLSSSSLVLSSVGNTYFDADASIGVLSQSTLPFSATSAINAIGGIIRFQTGGDDVFASNLISISSGNGQNIGFAVSDLIDVIAQNDINFDANGDLDLLTTATSVAASGDLTYTSNNAQDVTLYSDFGNFIIANGGQTFITGDNLYSSSLILEVFASNITYTTNSTIINVSDAALLESNNNFTINAESMTTNLASFQFVVSSYLVNQNTTWTACSGNITLNVGTFTYISNQGVPISQLVSPCQSCGTSCQPGNFEILSVSNRTQTINTNYIPFIADKSIDINGGGLLFQTLNGGSINFTTSNGVTVTSYNYPNYLTGAGDDVLTAGLNLNITINGAAEFIANGFENTVADPNYGIIMETTHNPLYSVVTNYTVKVPNGEINQYAIDVLRLATLKPLYNTDASLNYYPNYPDFLGGQYVDLTVAATRDVILNGGNGSITVTAGNFLGPELDPIPFAAGIYFLSVIADISVEADLAQIVFTDLIGFEVTSLSDNVTFTSVLDQTHISQLDGGAILYHSNFGLMNFFDNDDTSIIAGSLTQDASIAASATAQINITSGQSQIYASTAAVTDPLNNAINIIAEQGNIYTQTPSSLDFTSDGYTNIFANVGTLTITVNNNINYYAAGRIDYNSQQTSNFTVSNGNLEFTAQGGGGSITIVSDDAQDIQGLAGQGIVISAATDAGFYAIAGMNYTSNTGDIILSNAGTNTDFFVLSQGSVVLQASSTGGVAITGLSFHADAFEDVYFDASSFTIDSTSATNTATEPIIEFNAGGSAGTEGLVVNSVGQMQWTTASGSGVQVYGNKIDFEVTSNVIIGTNGPILFENKGQEDAGVFTITTTVGTFTGQGSENAAIAGITSAQFNTQGAVVLKSIGTDAGDGINILTKRDLDINAADNFAITTNTLDAQLSGVSVTATNNIVIQNTIGNGGTLAIDSDMSLVVDSVGPVLITSSGPATISSDGSYSNINFDSQAGLTLTSGSGTFFDSDTLYADAPHGISLTSTGGAIEVTASDDIQFIANTTFTLIGRNSIDISTGAIDSTFSISSTGTETFRSVNGLSIDAATGNVNVIADTQLTIDNLVPARPRDQGDIFITSYGTTSFTSGADADYNIGRYYAVTVNDKSRIVAEGNVLFETTQAGASILLNAQNAPIDVYAYDTLTLAAGAPETTGTLTVTSTQSLQWLQTYEQGFGGITIETTGATSTLALDVGGYASFVAETSMQGTSNGYISFFSVSEMNFGSYADQGDIIFQAAQSDVNVLVGTDFSSGVFYYQNQYDENTLAIQSFGSQAIGDPNSALYIQSHLNTILFQTFSDSSIISTSGGYITFETAAYPGRGINSDSNAATNIVANGIDDTLSYAVSMSAVNQINFVSPNVISIHSEDGTGFFNASRSLLVNVADQIVLIGGNDFFVFSGFTPQPNAQPPDRTAIQFLSTNDILISSNYNDVVFLSEDASWSVSSTLYLRSSQVGGSFSFLSPYQPLQINANSATFTADNLIITSPALTIAGNTVSFLSQNDLTIEGSSLNFYSQINDIFIGNSYGDIIFANTNGFVDFQLNGVNARQHLIVPDLNGVAGVSAISYQYPYRRYAYFETNAYQSNVESEYPGCEERAMGFDETTGFLCVCDFNKWRCAFPMGTQTVGNTVFTYTLTNAVTFFDGGNQVTVTGSFTLSDVAGNVVVHAANFVVNDPQIPATITFTNIAAYYTTNVPNQYEIYLTSGAARLYIDFTIQNGATLIDPGTNGLYYSSFYPPVGNLFTPNAPAPFTVSGSYISDLSGVNIRFNPANYHVLF